MGDGRARCHARSATIFNHCVEIGDEGGDLRLSRFGFLVLLRWHLARIHLLHSLGPVVGVGTQFEVARELVEAEVAFLFILSVATDAVLLNEGFVGFRRMDGGCEAKAQGDEQVGWGEVSVQGHFDDKKGWRTIWGGRHCINGTAGCRVKFLTFN